MRSSSHVGFAAARDARGRGLPSSASCPAPFAHGPFGSTLGRRPTGRCGSCRRAGSSHRSTSASPLCPQSSRRRGRRVNRLGAPRRSRDAPARPARTGGRRRLGALPPAPCARQRSGGPPGDAEGWEDWPGGPRRAGRSRSSSGDKTRPRAGRGSTARPALGARSRHRAGRRRLRGRRRCDEPWELEPERLCRRRRRPPPPRPGRRGRIAAFEVEEDRGGRDPLLGATSTEHVDCR